VKEIEGKSMKRKKRSGAKLLTASATVLLATPLFFGQLAYAGSLGDTLKQTAVTAVSYVSPTYSQKLNNTNVTQTVKSTVGSAVGTFKSGVGSVVGAFAGPQAAKVVSTGTWGNALSVSGAMTAGKVVASTVIGAGFGKAAGSSVYNTNLRQTVSNVYSNSVAPRMNTVNQYLGAGKSLAMGTASQAKDYLLATPTRMRNSIMALPTLPARAVDSFKSSSTFQRMQNNIMSLPTHFNSINQRLGEIADSVSIVGVGFNYDAFGTTAQIYTRSGSGIGIASNDYGTSIMITSNNTSSTYIFPKDNSNIGSSNDMEYSFPSMSAISGRSVNDRTLVNLRKGL